jgi:hypothetical protein
MDQVGELMSTPRGFEEFVAQLLGDEHFASSAVAIRNALTKLDIEADGNPDAVQMLRCLEIVANKSTSLAERVEEMHRITSAKGKTLVIFTTGLE